MLEQRKNGDVTEEGQAEMLEEQRENGDVTEEGQTEMLEQRENGNGRAVVALIVD